MNDKKRVAIIGGGITGLAAAFKLEKSIKESQLPIEYELYEAGHQLGGKIQTDYTDGFVIEKGPDSFLARKESMSRLAREVGLEHDFIHNDTGQAYILKEGILHPIPGGAIMGIPTELTPFALTKLFSPLGKIRALGDFILPKTTEKNEDISVGHFFRKRLGNEVVDHLIEPLLSGIYAGNIDRLSLQATFPQFQQIEEKHQSLIKGMKQTRGKQQENSAESKPKKGMFLTFKHGLKSFVDAIEAQLSPTAIHLQTSIKKVEKKGDVFELLFEDGTSKEFDDVIITTAPHITASLLNTYPFFKYLENMEATSVATIALAYKKEAVHNPYKGTGFVVSRKSDYSITACTWTHKKWPHSTPEGHVLLRCYVGRPDDADIVDKSDEEIVATVLRDLQGIMEINDSPLFYKVTRWKESMPQYHVGHTYKLAKIKEDIARHLQGLHLAGAGFEGIGLPDCIDQGEDAVDSILRNM
ncbi:protoporphyrinogen oxidase [Halalkalibacter urbisdiaboli]|uniref:protoporphyrinogen oxidase n=1 Tax=Halalkalibacter urbisdiaboli TaxID=1960589 RepID=UPI000B445468|nr:protoporphyrinogen oxidase [Halalkalibacter urbisdiaboli]